MDEKINLDSFQQKCIITANDAQFLRIKFDQIERSLSDIPVFFTNSFAKSIAFSKRKIHNEA